MWNIPKLDHVNMNAYIKFGFVWFDSLRPINNLSVKQQRAGLPGLSQY